MKKALTKHIINTALIFRILTLAALAQADTIVGDYLKEKDIGIEVSSTIDYYDKYVWRGFLLDDDHVIQPGVTFSGYGFEGGFWGSWDLQSDDALASDEVDGWIGYGLGLGFLGESWEKVRLSAGHIWYDFPEVDLYSKEFYLSASLDIFLSPYITWYTDYEEEAHGGANGNYLLIGIGHSLTLNEKYGISLDLGLEYGYNDNAFIDGTGSYLLTTAGLTLPLTEKISLSPVIGYSVPYGDLESGGGNDQKEQFYSGLTLAFNF